MTKNERIIELFQRDFDFKYFRTTESLKRNDFHCPYIESCKVDTGGEPIWTGYLGDKGTSVMVVAEAPSSAGGIGPFIGGMISEENKNNFVNEALFNFVRKYYNTVPYFTDVMKCGLSKQTRTNKSKKFKLRKEKCVQRYLVKEIEIISPTTILCIGNTAFNVISDLMRNNKNIVVIQLVHYSKQANLPLSQHDKEEIVWPYQAGLISSDELSQLSFFKKHIKN